MCIGPVGCLYMIGADGTIEGRGLGGGRRGKEAGRREGG